MKPVSEQVGSKVPPRVKQAIERAVEKGLAVTPSDYIREAIIDKLKKDKLLNG